MSPSASASSALDPALASRLVGTAAEADEAAVSQLGVEVGARALLAAVADDAHRRTALLAIPHAVDAETVLDALAARARENPRDDELVLEAIARIVAEPRFDELLAPEGIVRCHASLRALAADANRSAGARALAETATRRLEEYARGRVSLGSPR